MCPIMAMPPQSPTTDHDPVAKLKEGPKAWNVWRSANPQIRPDLSEAKLHEVQLGGANLSKVDLSNADLSKANLTDCDLSNANLKGANLEGTDLSRAIFYDTKVDQRTRLVRATLVGTDLSGATLHEVELDFAECNGANLSDSDVTKSSFQETKLRGACIDRAKFNGATLFKADLRGASLEGASFADAELIKADLRDTSLRGTDLSNAKPGVLPWQLAGADLTGAKLPEPLEKLYDKMGAVSEISDSAKKLFLGLLAGCLYCWLTIGTTKDVDLYANRASSPLPIIQTAIPIVGFYVVAPIILLCIYCYFHFYLQKLWEELAHFPAIFPDGKPLYQRTDPWLFNDLVRAHFSKLNQERPFLSYLQQWVSIFLAWWLVPLTLLLFWGRYLSRREVFWIFILGLLWLTSTTFAFQLYRLAKDTMKGKQRRAFTSQEDKFGSILLGLLIASAIISIVLVGTFIILELPNLRFPIETGKIDSTPTTTLWVRHFLVPNFNDTDISTKPPTWTGKKDDELNLVKGADLSERDLNYVEASRVFLAKANLSGTKLRGSILTAADLRRANLEKADLTDATLKGSDLTDAVIISTNFTGADLSNADLSNTNFSNFTAFGPSPDLHPSGPELEYANLRGAKGLRPDAIHMCVRWNMAFYDADTLKQLGLPIDHNEALQAYRESKCTEHLDSWETKWHNDPKKAVEGCKIFRLR